MDKQPWWQGLVARVTLAYALGSVILSSIVALFTLSVAQNTLLEQAEEDAIAAFVNRSRTVRRDLERLPADADEEARIAAYNQIVENEGNVQLSPGTSSALVPPDGGQSRGQVVLASLPAELREAVQLNQIALQRYTAEGEDGPQTRFVIGIGYANLGKTEYYEQVSLSEVTATIGNLRRILFSAAAMASIAGAALGYYAAGRALAPVSRISHAAREISAGNFKTRLDLQTDPDLAVLSRSFNEMVDALAARIERDERFTSDVSHELRSPLMTLTASVEILERSKSALPERAQRAVELLRDDLRRFEHLVEDLLEISRLDAGAVQINLGRLGLAEFLTNVIAQSQSPEIELSHPQRDRNLIVAADKRRLAQVMTNLIENARKYGGGATSISFRRVGDKVTIAVEDRGPGVAPEDRKKVFDRFSRAAQDAGKRSADAGVGLGLSLVAEHVRLHEGRVWVTDRVDGQNGARFVVELPIGDQVPDDEEMAF